MEPSETERVTQTLRFGGMRARRRSTPRPETRSGLRNARCVVKLGPRRSNGYQATFDFVVAGA